jgi:hypothetical protein
MSNADTISGKLVQYDIPYWEPLYDLVGVNLAEWFIWTCEIELADPSKTPSGRKPSRDRPMRHGGQRGQPAGRWPFIRMPTSGSASVHQRIVLRAP